MSRVSGLPAVAAVEQLAGERGQDHVDHGGFERAADEPAADGAGRVLADAVGFHARLFEQPAVDRELPVGRVLGLGQSAMSCSIAQRLVCLACSVSWIATPKQRRIARWS